MSEETIRTKSQRQKQQISYAEPICGIIMPISPIDGCGAEHWQEVKNIFEEAIKEAGYKPNLVSDSNDSGVIQKRIVQNIYDNEIVICDVSCKNPNVMFELGMRLAFDKPTIVIIDDKTNYSFDTAPIEHLNYPRDLNYYKIKDFQKKIVEKIKGTIESAKTKGYTTFLKHFGEFKVAEIEHKEGTFNDVIISKLDEILSVSKVVNKNYIEETEKESNSINAYMRKIIDKYCTDNLVAESVVWDNENNEKENLFEYASKDPIIQVLCKKKSRLQTAIDSNLCPF